MSSKLDKKNIKMIKNSVIQLIKSKMQLTRFCELHTILPNFFLIIYPKDGQQKEKTQ